MKTTLVLALTVISSVATANEVRLNSNDVVIDAAEATIIRTSHTPAKVKITMKVPVTKQVCERFETRYTTSTVNCGYRPYGGGIYYGRGPYGGYPVYAGGMYGMCQQQQTYCAQYKTITDHEYDSVKIKFKNLPALGGSEEESFKLKARQKKFDSSNMVYSLEAEKTQGPYSIQDKGILGIDRFVIEAAE